MKIAIYICLSVLLMACQPASYDEFLVNGKSNIAQGNYSEAVIQFKNAVRLSPENGEARFLLGQSYLKLDRLDFAEKELERALELNYSKQEIIPLLSDLYYQLGNETSLLNISAQNSGLTSIAQAKLTFQQAHSYLRKGQHNKVKLLVEDIKSLKNVGEYGQLALTLNLLADNQLDAALLQLQQVLKDYPAQKDALKLAAQLHLANRTPMQAIRLFERYIEHYPDDHEQQLTLARLYSDLDKPLKAEPLVDKLLLRYSQVPLLLQLKALARFKQDDFQSAFDHAAQALQINAEDNTVRFIAGISAYHNQDMEMAHRHLSFMASLFPANHPGLRYLAETQLQLGLTIEASETALRFEALSEQDVTLLSKVGSELVAKGELNRATQIKNQPDINLTSPKALTNVGLLKLSLNDVTGVLDLETAVKQLNTDGRQQTAAELEATLAQAYLFTGKTDQALAISQKWLSQPETVLQGHLLSAKVYRTQNDLVLAKQAYLDALAIDPSQPGVKFALIEISPFKTIKQAQRALYDASKIIKQHPDFLPAIVFHYMMAKRLGIEDKMIIHLQSRLAQSPLGPNNIRAITRTNIRTNTQNKTNTQTKTETVQNEKHKMQITLAKMVLLEEDFAQAISLLEQAKTDTPAPYWSHLANAYIQVQAYEKAANLYQEWHQKQPNNPNAIVGQIKVLHVKGEIEEALKLSERYLTELGGKHPDVQGFHAQLLVLNKQIPDAVRFFNDLDPRLQQTPFLKGVLGQIQLHQKQFKPALANLKAAYDVAPSPQNAKLVAHAHINLSGAQAAAKFLNEHLKTHDKDLVNTLFVADLLIDIDTNQAIIYYRRVLAIQPDNFMALNNLAYLLVESGVLEEAYELAKQALTIQPDNLYVLDTVGAIALKLDKNEQALKHLTKAYNLSEQDLNDDLLVNYIEALFKNNQHKLAQRSIKRHLIDDPEQAARLEQLKKQYL